MSDYSDEDFEEGESPTYVKRSVVVQQTTTVTKQAISPKSASRSRSSSYSSRSSSRSATPPSDSHLSRSNSPPLKKKQPSTSVSSIHEATHYSDDDDFDDESPVRVTSTVNKLTTQQSRSTVNSGVTKSRQTDGTPHDVEFIVGQAPKQVHSIRSKISNNGSVLSARDQELHPPKKVTTVHDTSVESYSPSPMSSAAPSPKTSAKRFSTAQPATAQPALQPASQPPLPASPRKLSLQQAPPPTRPTAVVQSPQAAVVKNPPPRLAVNKSPTRSPATNSLPPTTRIKSANHKKVKHDGIRGDHRSGLSKELLRLIQVRDQLRHDVATLSAALEGGLHLKEKNTRTQYFQEIEIENDYLANCVKQLKHSADSKTSIPDRLLYVSREIAEKEKSIKSLEKERRKVHDEVTKYSKQCGIEDPAILRDEFVVRREQLVLELEANRMRNQKQIEELQTQLIRIQQTRANNGEKISEVQQEVEYMDVSKLEHSAFITLQKQRDSNTKKISQLKAAIAGLEYQYEAPPSVVEWQERRVDQQHTEWEGKVRDMLLKIKNREVNIMSNYGMTIRPDHFINPMNPTELPTVGVCVAPLTAAPVIPKHPRRLSASGDVLTRPEKAKPAPSREPSKASPRKPVLEQPSSGRDVATDRKRGAARVPEMKAPVSAPSENRRTNHARQAPPPRHPVDNLVIVADDHNHSNVNEDSIRSPLPVNDSVHDTPEPEEYVDEVYEEENHDDSTAHKDAKSSFVYHQTSPASRQNSAPHKPPSPSPVQVVSIAPVKAAEDDTPAWLLD